MSHATRRIIAGGLAVAAATSAYIGLAGGGGTASAAPGVHGKPLVIGHRGASAYRPEHTLSAYKLAIDTGADYIEPDVVATKDHKLVARHDNWLADTTDVESHPEFADRRVTKTIDGVTRTDWFTEDFTLAELRTLRAEERLPDLRPNNTVFNGLDTIPTLDEVLALARTGHVGVYPETKHPTYFDGLGLSLEEPLLATLKKHGFTGRHDPVYIQSFETANLRELRTKTSIRLIQLIDATGRPFDFTVAGDPRTYDDLVTPAGLRFIASYAAGIGPATARIVPLDATGRTTTPTTLVRDAHRRHLAVHTWTLRPENNFLPADFRQGNPSSPLFLRTQGDAAGWLAKLYRLGIDGVFSDDPALAVATRTEVFSTGGA
jgi:glycerophosphoryl diester phosphodiesterase